MPKDFGEPILYDPNFNGPTRNRSCTDILWLIVFILFLAFYGVLGYYSIRNGDVKRLLAPMDSEGHRCGVDSEVVNKKYLVFFDIKKCLIPGSAITGCPTPQVCVEQCPSKAIFFSEMTSIQWPEYRQHMVCTRDVDIATITHNQALDYIRSEKCANYLLPSNPVLFRCIGDLSVLSCKNGAVKDRLVARQEPTGDSCLRDPEKDQSTLMNGATVLDSYVGMIVGSWVTFFTGNERDLQVIAAQIAEDLVKSRWYMAGALFGVVLICFIYVILLRWVVGPVMWTSITALIGLLGFSIYLCYKNYIYYRDHPVTIAKTTNFVAYVAHMFTKQESWLALLIILSIVTLILLLIVIFLRSRIVIAIAIIKEGSKAVGDIKSTIILPMFSWIFQCAVLAYGLTVFMHLLASGEPSFSVVNLANDTTCHCSDPTIKDYEPCDITTFSKLCQDTSTFLPCRQATCHFTGLDKPAYTGYLQVVNLLGFFWLLFFIQGVSDMILASTFSTWYWTFKKRDLPFFTLSSGICTTISYHMGTVALGSLIIAIVRVIRVLLEYINHKVKKFDNSFIRCILCMCRCCFACLESFLKFINKNAYIMCAIHGHSFCKSARDAFSLLMRNIVRVVVLDKVTNFIFFLSKLLISIAVGMGVYYIQKWQYVYDITKGEPLHYAYVPAIILTIATYVITTIFFNVYSMSVDTLFLCFLEDVERNDGSPEKPYFMSKNLKKILGKKNKIE